jgi:hypothetical protein
MKDLTRNEIVSRIDIFLIQNHPVENIPTKSILDFIHYLEDRSNLRLNELFQIYHQRYIVVDGANSSVSANVVYEKGFME